MTDTPHQHVTRLRLQIMSVVRRLRQESPTGSWSLAQLTLLGAIDRLGGQSTPTELASAERLHSSNLAALLRELDAGGLIQRNADIQDRRKTRVSLTQEGRTVLDGNRTQREAWLVTAMKACLNQEEYALLIQAGALLERIAACDETSLTTGKTK
jgi:DNA-binding MarR family transcriptional regulator